ncbi:Hypothetical predicted protein [Mytilus galloprovincialis]|uniref:B box-type domain-containing protein n=1 Tax=Mytilus galloprovincialis TaxID=29158 RepID=A0A8B6FCE6_MYTGA|nr:Hypothetical predicted protein [Mytilus galloprovincialis]
MGFCGTIHSSFIFMRDDLWILDDSNISPYCSLHDRKFQNYCPQHESIGCPLCIQSNHANCVGILSLENVIQTAKTSALLESLDQNLRDNKINAERIEKDRKHNLAEIKKQGQKFHDDIKQVRRQINEHLDSLEQLLLKDLYAAEEKVISQIEDLLEKLTKHTELLAVLQSNMSAIKEYASNLQAFLGSKMIEKETKKHELFMQSLFEDGSLQKVDLNYEIADKISDVLSTVTSFGSIYKETSSPLVEMQTEKVKQAQIGSFHRAPPINDLKMTFTGKLEFTGVTGCSFSSTEDTILVDYAKRRLLVLNGDGTLKNDILLSNQYPVDVTCIDDKTVAVSFQYSNQIQIINILTKTIEKWIKATNYCYGICYIDGHLFYCVACTGIQKVKLSDHCPYTLVKDDTLSNWSFVTTSKDKIFYTNNKYLTVTCCSFTGQKLWKYKDQSVHYPLGIAVDNESNVYIASKGNNSIIVLSSDGKPARKLLVHDDGICNPYGLAFNVTKEKLIVANYDGPSLYGFY